ncbi:MAG: hypothetical protein QM666_04175 [Acinetobacter sp.]
MYDFNIYRNQWIEAYYDGDYSMLDFLESSDFYVRTNNRTVDKTTRLKRISNLNQVGKWSPVYTKQNNLEFKNLDNNMIITGVIEDGFQIIKFTEHWQIADARWKICYLIMETCYE